MARFLGTSFYQLDEKNRLAIPSRYRKDFGDQEVILVKGPEPCVLLLNEETFELVQEEFLSPLNTLSIAGRNAQRTFMASVTPAGRDAQYRFVLPGPLAGYAGLVKGQEAAIVGTGKWLEIWNAARWAEYEAEGMNTLREQLNNAPAAGHAGGGVRW